MNNKNWIITIVVALFISALFLPFLLSDSANIKVRVGANLLSGLGSSFTLIIAILLYNKYGINRTIVEKKREIILDILENIKRLNIMIEFNHATLMYKPGFPFNPIYETYYKNELLFNTDYYEGLKNIFNHVNSLYIPESISNKIKLLDPDIIMHTDKIRIDQAKVSIIGTQKRDTWFGEINEGPMTFLQFITYWDEIISEAKLWLKTNAGETIELNIE